MNNISDQLKGSLLHLYCQGILGHSGGFNQNIFGPESSEVHVLISHHYNFSLSQSYAFEGSVHPSKDFLKADIPFDNLVFVFPYILQH